MDTNKFPYIEGFFSPLHLQFKFFAELFLHFPAKKHGSPCLNYRLRTINELPKRNDKQEATRKRAHQEIQEGQMFIELGKHMNNNSENNNNKMASCPYSHCYLVIIHNKNRVILVHLLVSLLFICGTSSVLKF